MDGDRISKLPPAIIETILCLLPIQEAGRTSILSRDWRYHWTKIPKLAFDEDTFEVSTDRSELSVLEQTLEEPSERKAMTKRCKLFSAMYQVLLMHQGPIQEFALKMRVESSYIEIGHLILHHKLPVSLFSLHQLTELRLTNCALDLQPSFNGFGSPARLYLKQIYTSEKNLMRLVSGCHLLKRLTLKCNSLTILECEESTIVDLFECLPGVEYLSVWAAIVSSFAPERLPKKLPTMLVNLNCLFMKYVNFSDMDELYFLVLLIRSSPNLKKLKLHMGDEHDTCEIDSFPVEYHSNIWLEHLNELEIKYFCLSWHFELDFLKLILARSPVLEKVTILLNYKDEELQLSEILSNFPKASPEVKIIIITKKSSS